MVGLEPDGSCRYLISKQNTTYRHVQREDLEVALRLVTKEAVWAVPTQSPTKTLGECVSGAQASAPRRKHVGIHHGPVRPRPPRLRASACWACAAQRGGS